MQQDATSLSGFGGHKLEAIDAIDSEVLEQLKLRGITDAEQLVAIDKTDARKRLQRLFGSSQRFNFESSDSSQKSDYDYVIGAALALVPERINMVAAIMPPTSAFGRGALRPSEQNSEKRRTLPPVIAPAALPESVNWIPRLPMVRNQAARGTCVAFALTALHEYCLAQRGINITLSEQHLYYEAKQIDGTSAACGTWHSDAAQVLAERGQCRASVWPYSILPPCNNHGNLPANARSDAANYRFQAQPLPSNSVSAMKAALAEESLVSLSIPVYNSWFQSSETQRSGRITLRLEEEPDEGGHAIVLVGYQNDENAPGGGYFILRNSWNGMWGTECPYGVGYGTIPYQYITEDCWEAYTASPHLLPATQINANTEKPEVTLEIRGNVRIVINNG